MNYLEDKHHNYFGPKNFKKSFLELIKSSRYFEWSGFPSHTTMTKYLVHFLAHMYNGGKANILLEHSFFPEGHFVELCAYMLSASNAEMDGLEFMRIVKQSGTDMDRMFTHQKGIELVDFWRSHGQFHSAFLQPPSDVGAFCFRDGLFPATAYPPGYERIAKLILGEWEITIAKLCFRSTGCLPLAKIILSF